MVNHLNCKINATITMACLVYVLFQKSKYARLVFLVIFISYDGGHSNLYDVYDINGFEIQILGIRGLNI